MLTATEKRVYLACGYTDMRKSINGLSALVQAGFQLDVFDSALFVFFNKSRDRPKILEWDGDGFWLHLKRLERGHIKWPEVSGCSRKVQGGGYLMDTLYYSFLPRW